MEKFNWDNSIKVRQVHEKINKHEYLNSDDIQIIKILLDNLSNTQSQAQSTATIYHNYLKLCIFGAD